MSNGDVRRNGVDGLSTTSTRSRGRETMLALLLTLGVGGSFFMFMVFASGGFFFYALVITVGIGGLIGVNYFLWGRRFEDAARRERAALAEEDAAGEWKPSQPPWERRFGTAPRDRDE